MAADALARAAPKEWDDFGRALSGHFQAQLQNLKNSPPLDLYRMQGRAQHCGDLLDHLATCKADANKIRAASPTS